MNVVLDLMIHDIDIILNAAEETMELVATLRAHLGIPMPDYDAPCNQRR